MSLNFPKISTIFTLKSGVFPIIYMLAFLRSLQSAGSAFPEESRKEIPNKTISTVVATTRIECNFGCKIVVNRLTEVLDFKPTGHEISAFGLIMSTFNIVLFMAS